MLASHVDISRNQEIDLLRAYAVLCVWVLHCCLLMNSGFGINIPIKTYVNLEVGVDIFFVISGYVVSNSLYRISLSNSSVFVVFIKKRLKRLWLVASFWLLTCLMLGFLLQGTSDWPVPARLIQQFLSGLIYLFNFQEYIQPTALGYFWSLSVEFQFYLLLPVLFSLNKMIRVFIFSFLIGLGVFYRFGGEAWWMFRYDGILVGILLWDFRRRLHMIFDKVNKRLLKLLFIAVIILILIIDLKVDHPFIGKTLVVLLAGVLVGLAAIQKGATHGLGLEKAISWIGLRSYSIYLSHVPIAMLLISIFQSHYFNNLILFIAVYILIVLISSELSYRYLEYYKWPIKTKAVQATINN